MRDESQHPVTNQLTLIAVGGSDPQPKASGRVFWDKDNGRWHVFVFDMKPLPPGKEYELWFITPEQKKGAGRHVRRRRGRQGGVGRSSAGTWVRWH